MVDLVFIINVALDPFDYLGVSRTSTSADVLVSGFPMSDYIHQVFHLHLLPFVHLQLVIHTITLKQGQLQLQLAFLLPLRQIHTLSQFLQIIFNGFNFLIL